MSMNIPPNSAIPSEVVFAEKIFNKISNSVEDKEVKKTLETLNTTSKELLLNLDKNTNEEILYKMCEITSRWRSLVRSGLKDGNNESVLSDLHKLELFHAFQSIMDKVKVVIQEKQLNAQKVQISARSNESWASWFKRTAYETTAATTNFTVTYLKEHTSDSFKAILSSGIDPIMAYTKKLQSNPTKVTDEDILESIETWENFSEVDQAEVRKALEVVKPSEEFIPSDIDIPELKKNVDFDSVSDEDQEILAEATLFHESAKEEVAMIEACSEILEKKEVSILEKGQEAVKNALLKGVDSAVALFAGANQTIAEGLRVVRDETILVIGSTFIKPKNLMPVYLTELDSLKQVIEGKVPKWLRIFGISNMFAERILGRTGIKLATLLEDENFSRLGDIAFRGMGNVLQAINDCGSDASTEKVFKQLKSIDKGSNQSADLQKSKSFDEYKDRAVISMSQRLAKIVSRNPALIANAIKRFFYEIKIWVRALIVRISVVIVPKLTKPSEKKESVQEKKEPSVIVKKLGLEELLEKVERHKDKIDLIVQPEKFKRIIEQFEAHSDLFHHYVLDKISNEMDSILNESELGTPVTNKTSINDTVRVIPKDQSIEEGEKATDYFGEQLKRFIKSSPEDAVYRQSLALAISPIMTAAEVFTSSTFKEILPKWREWFKGE